MDFLEEPIAAFVRLSESLPLGDLTEVSLRTRFLFGAVHTFCGGKNWQKKKVLREESAFHCRFLFILLGPAGKVQSYHEIGRAMASSFADEVKPPIFVISLHI